MTEAALVPESNRARRRRLADERQALVDAALAAGASPDEAARQADEQQRDQAKALALAAAAASGSAPPGHPMSAEKQATRQVRRDADLPSIKAPKPARAPEVEAPAAGAGVSAPGERLIARFVAPSRVPARLGNLVYLVALINLLAALVRPWRDRLNWLAEYLPGAVPGVAPLFSVLSAVFLVGVAHSLKRRKRRAWWLAVALLSISLVANVLSHGVAPVAMLLTALTLGVLIVFRAEFDALADPGTRGAAVGALFGLLAASGVIGVLAVWLARRPLGADPWPGLGAALSYVVTGLLGLNGFVGYDGEDNGPATVVSALLLALGVLTLVVPLFLAFRSARQPSTLDAADIRQVRALLAEHPDSLGEFATRADKEIVWSESGRSGIGYRVVNGVLLGSGDPLGDPEAWPGAIRAFLELAETHGWTPAVLGCSELGGTIWVRETGFQALELGDEAIVDTRTFTLSGRAMRNVRQMVNRIRRQGYDTEMMRVRDTPPQWRAAALADAAAWRVGGTERGFSMATSRVFDAAVDPDAVVIVARREGVIQGMLQFVPWGSDGMSLDLMRRNPQADPGVNELLITDALVKAPELGVYRVSLNFAMFRSVFERGERLGAGPVLKAWRRVLVLGNRWFQLESLYRFNAKFQPVWYPRFVIYPRVADFVRVSIAMGLAEAFIVFPRLTWPWRR